MLYVNMFEVLEFLVTFKTIFFLIKRQYERNKHVILQCVDVRMRTHMYLEGKPAVSEIIKEGLYASTS